MRVGCLALVGLLVATAPAAADETTQTNTDTDVSVEPKAPQPLAQRLGTPARLGEVLAALRRLDRTNSSAALNLAQTLGRCGGVAAARGVVPLIRSAYPAVRQAALESAGEIGVRDRELVTFVREAILDKNERVAAAACRALGRLGDGDQFRVLLETAQGDKRRRVRTAAYRAMRELSGIKLPTVHARWRHWWKQRQDRASKALKSAIQALETPPSEDPGDEELAAREEHANVLLSDAWIELPLVRKTIEDWLYAEYPALRRLACEIVGAWRLPELAKAVRSSATTRWARPELKQASEEALRLLGVTND